MRKYRLNFAAELLLILSTLLLITSFQPLHAKLFINKLQNFKPDNTILYNSNCLPDNQEILTYNSIVKETSEVFNTTGFNSVENLELKLQFLRQLEQWMTGLSEIYAPKSSYKVLLNFNLSKWQTHQLYQKHINLDQLKVTIKTLEEIKKLT